MDAKIINAAGPRQVEQDQHAASDCSIWTLNRVETPLALRALLLILRIDIDLLEDAHRSHVAGI